MYFVIAKLGLYKKSAVIFQRNHMESMHSNFCQGVKTSCDDYLNCSWKNALIGFTLNVNGFSHFSIVSIGFQWIYHFMWTWKMLYNIKLINYCISLEVEVKKMKALLGKEKILISCILIQVDEKLICTERCNQTLINIIWFIMCSISELLKSKDQKEKKDKM